ncbi:MAG: DUF4258 domain-containing protein [Chitinophagaceae bacterium]
MNNKKAFPYILLLVLCVVVFLFKTCNKSNHTKTNNNTKTAKEQRGLNRNPSHINYSKHAKCRMDCRHIDELEIKDMLANGTINYKKSDLQKKDCQKRYAVEGYSKDKQHLRIIVAPCADEVTIITCIDLDTEWECHCEGDE